MEAILESTLTAEDKQAAIEYLIATRNEFMGSAAGMCDGQANFKPAPDVWSAAENAEHVAIVEEFATTRIPAMIDGEPAGPDFDPNRMDEMVRKMFPVREPKYPAPESVRPTGKFTLDQSVERFWTSRNRLIRMMDEPHCFRGRVHPFPVLGPMDGYQWVLAFAGHSVRHADQLRELKQHPDFPRG